MESKNILFYHSNFITLLCFKIRNDAIQKTHSLAQDPSHLATPYIGAQRPQVFFSPRGQPFLPCLVVLPLRREACFPVAGSPFCGPAWVLSSVASSGVTPDGAAWRQLASVQPASRQTTCYRRGNKTLGAVFTANQPGLPTNQAGRATERDLNAEKPGLRALESAAMLSLIITISGLVIEDRRR